MEYFPCEHQSLVLGYYMSWEEDSKIPKFWIVVYKAKLETLP